MNSWNRSTSYANDIKLHQIDKPDDIDSDTWWEMLWITEWQEKLSDLHEDFEDWTLSNLRERVELIQDFDRLSDDITAAYIELYKNYRITEEEILVPKTIKVLEPV